MEKGRVKVWNAERGFGFVLPEEGGKPVFVHATALKRAGIGTLEEGDLVTFETDVDKRSGKLAVSRIEMA